MSDISVQASGHACRIQLNRPDAGNVANMEMVAALTKAIQSIGPEVKLVVISGAGKDFCKGRDYQSAPEAAAAGKAPPNALALREQMTGPMMSLYTALRDCPVATLSLVQGAAHGFGCALAGACDMTIAATSARFRLPEMGRGLPPTLAMSALWERVSPRTIGYMVYSTAELTAAEALSAGLAHLVVPDSELESRGATLIETICKEPLHAIRTVKEYLREAPAMNSAGRNTFGASLFAGALSSR